MCRELQQILLSVWLLVNTWLTKTGNDLKGGYLIEIFVTFMSYLGVTFVLPNNIFRNFQTFWLTFHSIINR